MKYLKELLNYQKENNRLFNQTLNELLGEKRYDLDGEIDVEKMNLESSEELKLIFKLKNRFKVDKYNIEKLAKAIQNSRGGIGGSVMTRFPCKFCGKIEVWANTATPGICSECAEKMAKQIVLNLGKENMEEEFKKEY
jgi:hypothetical protein